MLIIINCNNKAYQMNQQFNLSWITFSIFKLTYNCILQEFLEAIFLELLDNDWHTNARVPFNLFAIINNNSNNKHCKFLLNADII